MFSEKRSIFVIRCFLTVVQGHSAPNLVLFAQYLKISDFYKLLKSGCKSAKPKETLKNELATKLLDFFRF